MEKVKFILNSACGTLDCKSVVVRRCAGSVGGVGRNCVGWIPESGKLDPGISGLGGISGSENLAGAEDITGVVENRSGLL